MPKINYRTLFVPESINFSDWEGKLSKESEDGIIEFELGDNSESSNQMISNIQADTLLMDLLFKFNDRQKIILCYQILRESGYNLNHEDCAKTLSVTREHYMFLLKEIKKKARKIIQQDAV